MSASSLLGQDGLSSLQVTFSLEDILVEKCDNSQLLSFLYQEWGLLFKNKLIDSPLLYSSEMVENVSLSVLRSWIILEKYFSGVSLYDVGSSTNLLITGPRGVGKTTLMKGLKVFIDKHGVNVKTLYLDFQQQHEKVLISENVPGFEQNNTQLTTVTFDPIGEKNGYGLMFYGDEIQALYEYKIDLNIRAVQEILSIGKSGCATGILSTSSSKVQSFAYKQGDLPEYSRYPNLNYTVYMEVNLLPLRTEKEFINMLKVKGINSENFNLLDLFHATGGIGRCIDRALSSRKGSASSVSISVGIPDILDKVEKDLKFRNVIGLFYQKY